MRRGFFVPSKWRMPECRRITFPVDVILKRLAAPRCVFNFIFLFFFTISSSKLSWRRPHGAPQHLVSLRNQVFYDCYAWPPAADCAGRAGGVATAPFFGAR